MPTPTDTPMVKFKCSIAYASFTCTALGGGTHRRRATFERCKVFGGGVRLGVWGGVLVVCVCVSAGGVVLCRCVCVCV